MSDRLPVFHIGANKAGSTTLQKALFARHPGVLSLGKPEPVEAALKAVSAIHDHCDSREQDGAPLDREALRANWQNAIGGANGRLPVFSREELVRYYLYGEPDATRLPRAIVDMAGPVRVVLIVRHQLRLIESLYLQKANSANFLDTEAWLDSQPDWFAFGFRFGEVADAWGRVVGRDNVGVFMFEEMVKDTASFGRRLCDFVGIDAGIGVPLLLNQHENVRKSGRTQAYAKFRSSLFPRVSFGALLPAPIRDAWRSYLEGGKRARVELPARWMDRIRDHYVADNRRLASEYHLPLKDHGYPL
ncbi:MAG: sulfotransferase [Pseudorhodoplanes sp.]|uniref:sulfotransferase n=1 Tax=Pseudorhodoplanes sp. TaxID=1934341 RepID=UPI003D11791B